MMAAAQPRSDIESLSTARSPAPEGFDVRLRFGSVTEASCYLRALTGLFCGRGFKTA
jgi:hypothetical protein